MNVIIGDFETRPWHIDTERCHHFYDAFPKREMEVSARWIVCYCQSLSAMEWHTFTLVELEDYVRANGGGTFQFFGLDTAGYVVLADGKYHVTDDFIHQCYQASKTYLEQNYR